MYTDGSCLKNPDGPGGYGTIVRFDKNGRLYEKQMAAGYEETTNNRMELMAVIKGFDLIPEKSNVMVYSDSKYVVNAFHKRWIDNWKRINWDRGSNGGPVKNTDLWKELLNKIALHDSVSFIWVKGHAGNPLNELCDSLAVIAAKEQKAFYKEGNVKEGGLPDNLSKNRKFKSPKRFDFSQKVWLEGDIRASVEKDESYVIIPYASFDGHDSFQGTYKVLMTYGGMSKVVRSNVSNCKSANEVALLGILDAVNRINYKNKTILIITGVTLGFSNPKKSSNSDLIDVICTTIENVGGKMQVFEVKKGMKGIRRIVTDYEKRNR